MREYAGIDVHRQIYRHMAIPSYNTTRRERCRVADHWRPVCHCWLNTTHGQHTLLIEYSKRYIESTQQERKEGRRVMLGLCASLLAPSSSAAWGTKWGVRIEPFAQGSLYSSQQYLYH